MVIIVVVAFIRSWGAHPLPRRRELLGVSENRPNRLALSRVISWLEMKGSKGMRIGGPSCGL